MIIYIYEMNCNNLGFSQRLLKRCLSSGLQRSVIWQKFTIIFLMMQAKKTSEILLKSYQTARSNNPEVCYLHSRLRENLKSHEMSLVQRLVKRHWFVVNKSISMCVTGTHIEMVSRWIHIRQLHGRPPRGVGWVLLSTYTAVTHCQRKPLHCRRK